jgi:transcriptional regulator with XRE-family HTH domain
MARPKGLRLNRFALADILTEKRLTMTQAAAHSGVALTTLSGLAQGDHRASLRTVEALASGIGCSAETLFPELAFTDLRQAAVA